MPAGAWSQSNDGRKCDCDIPLPLCHKLAATSTKCPLSLPPILSSACSSFARGPFLRHVGPVPSSRDTRQRNAALQLRQARLPLGALPEHASPLLSLPKLGALPKTGFKELFIQTACVPIAPVFSPPQKLQGKPRATAFFPQGKQRIN